MRAQRLSGSVQKVQGIFDRMIRENIKPSREAHSELVISYAKPGNGIYSFAVLLFSFNFDRHCQCIEKIGRNEGRWAPSPSYCIQLCYTFYDTTRYLTQAHCLID